MKANEAAKVLEQIEEGVTAKIEGAGVEIQRFTCDEDGAVYYWTVNGNTDALFRSDANKRLRGYRADVIEKITYHSPEEIEEEASLAELNEECARQAAIQRQEEENRPQKISYVVDEDGLNKYGTPSEVLFAAGQKLDRGEITEEAFRAVSQGDITLDQAVAMADIGRAVESDMEGKKTESKIRAATVAREKAEEEKPRRAKANPARKGEKPKKKEKEKANKTDKEPRYVVDPVKLKAIREEKGYNTNKLWKTAELKKDLVWHMEKKGRAVAMADLESLAKVLECKVEDFSPVAK